MSNNGNNGLDSPMSSPQSAPPHIKSHPQHSQSITDITPPSNWKTSQQRQAKREHPQDEKGITNVAQPGQPAKLHKVRSSVDTTRSEGVSPSMTPDTSRRTSSMMPAEGEVPPVLPLSGMKKITSDEKIRREREKAVKMVV